MRCIYCNHEKLYELKSGQKKCAKCKKKFSVKKQKTNMQIIEFFCNNLSVNETSKVLNLNYITVKKKFMFFRQLLCEYSEQQYQNKTVLEYDEYIYLEKSKKKVKENIFDAQNFLSFHYDDKIYTLLMPSLKMYKSQFLQDGADNAYFKEFSKFMMLNKISKTQKRENLITKFWLFFEDSIVKYKGINHENFFYYLKEIEFKFNYTKKEQKEILQTLMR